MAIGTLSIAGLPGYATLGILAPLLVLVARLLVKEAFIARDTTATNGSV